MEIGQVQVESNQILFTDKAGEKIYKTGLMYDPELTNRLHESAHSRASTWCRA